VFQVEAKAGFVFDGKPAALSTNEFGLVCKRLSTAIIRWRPHFFFSRLHPRSHPIMMSLAPFCIYRDHTAYLCHGYGLWEPDPGGLYQQVAIGDVGFIYNGCFVRMFNVLVEWNDPSNCTLFIPEPFPRLESGPFVNVHRSILSKGDYYSHYVTSEQDMLK
jgi:hypothetical protein